MDSIDDEMDAEFDNRLDDAIEAFLTGCTVPLVADGGERAGVEGTSLLLSLRDHLCLVTAAHVAEQVLAHGARIGVPRRPGSGWQEVVPVGGRVEVLSSGDETQDVAILRVTDPDLADTLRLGWTAADGAQLAEEQPSMHLFHVAGYPRALTRELPSAVRGSLLLLRTRRYDGVTDDRSDPPDLKTHILLHHSSVTVSRAGRTLPMPDLRGLSGGSIWGEIEATSPVWSPLGALRLLAVQISVLPNRWIRGTRWRAVANLFASFDAVAATWITDQLDRSQSLV